MTHHTKLLEVDYDFSDVLGKFEKCPMILKHNQWRDSARRDREATVSADLKETISNQVSFSNTKDLVGGCDLL